ncbi:hypothetical protein VPNG_03270 [Cytospora leucostoma]|uniref:Uncharacterized protein n=1 Tax=Cytospora leucostoma TaxID=1230097 RepID=A0A423XF66_9PEZI|nr:hypothetical protein VPNG_03270 [Cytospora leucostoma]
MAQGPVAALQSTAVPVMASESSVMLSEEEKHQLRECERIINFRDEVLSGAHPRIKVPAHLVASKKSSELSSPPSGPAASVINVPTGPKAARSKHLGPNHALPLVNNLRSFNANAQQSFTPAPNTAPGQIPGLEQSFGSSINMPGVPTGPRATTAKRPSENSGNVQFDPVLLTKSDDLIKAELALQRKRLESALSEQLQQHKATRNTQSAEAPADFDLANVLMEALLRVQRSALPQTDTDVAANASGAASDSVDDDTFYSSKHDTPESTQTHRIPTSVESGDARAREDSHYEPPMVIEASPVPGQPFAVANPPLAVTGASTAQAQQHRNPQVFASASESRNFAATMYPNKYQQRPGLGDSSNTGAPMEIVSSQDSGEASSSQESRQANGEPSSAQRHLVERGLGRRQSPILRVHNLSPVAPQPAHVSPLASSHQPPVPQLNAPPAQATPAQVAALRNDRSNGSSPESSPQGGKPNKKGKKKNKRKADRMATNNETTPYIKPEPRSPSPITVPQFSRPNKRPRQVQRSAQEQGYENPRVEGPVDVVPQNGYPARVYREDRGPPGYDSPIRQDLRQDSRSIVLTEPSRYEGDPHDDIRPAETVQYVRRASPGAHPYQYAPGEVRTIRSVSRAAIDRSHAYYDSRDGPRTVVRHVADRDRSRSPIIVEERPPNVMGPPRLPRTRVVHVDEYGREYLDPAPRPESVIARRSVVPRPVYDDREEYYELPRSTTVVRRSVAPASAYGEPEFIYERAPPPIRAASTMPSSGRYDEEAIYRGAASPAGYATTRRVVTRPADYAVPEYRYYRERDYPAPPPGGQVGDGFYEVRGLEDRRPGNEHAREYRLRGTTVRPEPPARPDVIRMTSVRPEPVAGEYAAPIILDERRPMPPPRAYSVRPMAAPQQQQPPQQYLRQWPDYETRAYGEQVEEAREDASNYLDVYR